MRNGFTVDMLTSVDIQEIVEMCGKVIRTYQGVIYPENFKKISFLKNYREFIQIKSKIHKQKNNLMQGLVKLNIYSLYGVQKREDLLSHITLNRKLGWKQNLLKMYWVTWNYLMKLIL